MHRSNCVAFAYHLLCLVIWPDIKQHLHVMCILHLVVGVDTIHAGQWTGCFMSPELWLERIFNLLPLQHSIYLH